jgi:hypothetical protein
VAQKTYTGLAYAPSPVYISTRTPFIYQKAQVCMPNAQENRNILKKNILTQYREPTDLELQAIIEQVLAETKQKFAGIHDRLKQTIAAEIHMAKSKFETK